MKLVIYLCIFNSLLVLTLCNKYSKEANSKTKDPHDLRPISLKHLDKPFRMAKLNLLWSKAITRLSETKLKILLGELKLHDKEEITWKHLRAEGKDKDGLKEAELRKKLIRIMTDFNLLDQAEDINDEKKTHPHKALNEASDKHINKSLFTDKKLNKLWAKAETAGFTAEELTALKEEFDHHQEKVDQWYQLLHEVRGKENDHDQNTIEDDLDKFNTIETLEEKDNSNDNLRSKVNRLREHNKNIQEGYDHLSILAAKGPGSREFIEPKVQGLWNIALQSDFTPSELESLRSELMHYENRLLKLRHMQAEHAIAEDAYQEKRKIHGKQEGLSLMEDNIKKHSRKLEKLHLNIETKIMQKHIEL